MSVPADVRVPPERPSGSQFTLPTWSRQAPPVPMTNGSPKTAPPPRRLEPIIVPPVEPSRPSRSLADWMILAGMFIFLVILSHGQMTTANELKKLNERMGPAQLGVSPATVPPPCDGAAPSLSGWCAVSTANPRVVSTALVGCSAAQIRVFGGYLPASLLFESPSKL